MLFYDDFCRARQERARSKETQQMAAAMKLKTENIGFVRDDMYREFKKKTGQQGRAREAVVPVRRTFGEKGERAHAYLTKQ